MPRGVKGPWGPSDLEAAIEAAVEGEPYGVVEKEDGYPGSDHPELCPSPGLGAQQLGEGDPT